MKITSKQQNSRQMIKVLEKEIDTVIDVICVKYNYTVNYEEINSAMLRVMTRMNQWQLKEMNK